MENGQVPHGKDDDIKTCLDSNSDLADDIECCSEFMCQIKVVTWFVSEDLNYGVMQILMVFVAFQEYAVTES